MKMQALHVADETPGDCYVRDEGGSDKSESDQEDKIAMLSQVVTRQYSEMERLNSQLQTQEELR